MAVLAVPAYDLHPGKAPVAFRNHKEIRKYLQVFQQDGIPMGYKGLPMAAVRLAFHSLHHLEIGSPVLVGKDVKPVPEVIDRVLHAAFAR